MIVTNIAPGTSEATISEFFGFCGRIVNLRLENGENSMTAHITFETVNAANTSLLLANAMIADRAIQVAMDPAGAAADVSPKAPEGEFPSYPADQLNEGEGASLTGGHAKAEPNAATRTIAQMLAAGHKLSDTAVAEAKALDERYQVSNKVQAGLGEVKTALTGLSERIGLTQRANDAYTAVSTKAQESGLPQKASVAAAATEDFFSAFARSASSTIQSVAQTGATWAEENLPNAVAKLREAGTALGAHAETIRSEAQQIYPGAVPQQEAPAEQPAAHAANAMEADAPVPAPATTGTPSIL